MRRRPVLLSLSALTYAAFALTVAWAVVFLSGTLVAHTVDGPVRVASGQAVATDVALLLVFAVQHSVMARRPVKRALARWVPRELERTTFVAATVGCLVMLFVLWQPVGEWVWHLEGATAGVLWAGCVAGWALALLSTFVIDHLEFIGLRQTGWSTRSGSGSPSPFIQGGLYGIVRHPMMLGLLVAFWCTPRMSAGHLLFAVAASGYIVVGVRFEERDLRGEIGPAYGRYAERVPSLVPRWRSLVPRWRRRRGADLGGARVSPRATSGPSGAASPSRRTGRTAPPPPRDAPRGRTTARR